MGCKIYTSDESVSPIMFLVEGIDRHTVYMVKERLKIELGRSIERWSNWEYKEKVNGLNPHELA